MKPTRGRAVWLMVFAAAALALPGNSQSVYPVRFDTQVERAPATLENSSSFQVFTDTHYSKRIALTVTAGVIENLLRITASEADTTVSASVSGFAHSSGDEALLALKEFRQLATYSGTVFGETSQLVAVKNAANFDLEFSASSNELTLRANTPASHDLLTVWIEVFTSEPVTFTELY